MVDTYGRWTYELHTPEYRKCDCDKVADIIIESGYVPLTGIENLTIMVIIYFEEELERNEMEWPDDEHLEELLMEYVESSGGWQEFDYEA